MKKFASIGITLALVSCTSLDTNRIAPGYKEAFQATMIFINGDKSSNFSFAEINKIPYASMLLSIGKGPNGLLILESKNNNKETWVSADNVRFLIENGRIVQTSGLESNLTDLMLPKEIRESPKSNLNNFSMYYSYDFPLLIGLEVVITRKNYGKQEVILTSGKKYLYLIEEKILNKQTGWKTINKFWFDDSNFVWKSEQEISPKLPVIKFEVTKKPS